MIFTSLLPVSSTFSTFSDFFDKKVRFLKFLEHEFSTFFYFRKNKISSKNPSFGADMNESDKKFSVYQARVVLQYLNDQVYQQTDRVKLIEDNLSQCQR